MNNSETLGLIATSGLIAFIFITFNFIHGVILKKGVVPCIGSGFLALMCLMTPPLNNTFIINIIIFLDPGTLIFARFIFNILYEHYKVSRMQTKGIHEIISSTKKIPLRYLHIIQLIMIILAWIIMITITTAFSTFIILESKKDFNSYIFIPLITFFILLVIFRSITETIDFIYNKINQDNPPSKT